MKKSVCDVFGCNLISCNGDMCFHGCIFVDLYMQLGSEKVKLEDIKKHSFVITYKERTLLHIRHYLYDNVLMAEYDGNKVTRFFCDKKKPIHCVDDISVLVNTIHNKVWDESLLDVAATHNVFLQVL